MSCRGHYRAAGCGFSTRERTFVRDVTRKIRATTPSLIAMPVEPMMRPAGPAMKHVMPAGRAVVATAQTMAVPRPGTRRRAARR